MKKEVAEIKLCPYINTLCITDKCLAWVITVEGKKEIDRKIEPYDMTPMDISGWTRHIENNGYENIGRDGGFRDVYVKYEEAYEGYCKLLEQRE